MTVGAFDAMNAVGPVAFAVVGAPGGADADLDLSGVGVLGMGTALGDGILQDVLAGRVPVALRTTADVTVALAGVGVGVVLARAMGGRLRLREEGRRESFDRIHVCRPLVVRKVLRQEWAIAATDRDRDGSITN